jgi:hypothetical protein
MAPMSESILLGHHSAFQRLPLYISILYANHPLTPLLTPTILQMAMNDLDFEYSSSGFQLRAPAPA